MEDFDADCLEFLDLSDVDEGEKLKILQLVKTWDPCIKGPWKPSSSKSHQEGPFGDLVPLAPSSQRIPSKNLILTIQQEFCPPIIQKGGLYQGYEPETVVGYGNPQVYSSNVNYQMEGVAPFVENNNQNIVTKVILNSNINYVGYVDNGKTCINTQLEISQNYAGMDVKLENGDEMAEIERRKFIEDAEKNLEGSNEYRKNLETKRFINETRNTSSGFKVNEENKSAEIRITNQVNEEDKEVKKPERKSWASLFGKSEPAPVSPQNISKPSALVPPFNCNKSNGDHNLESASKEPPPHLNDPNYYRMAEFLTDYKIDNKITSLQPRGLINKSNYCYINSVLQALLACPPVYNLLIELSKNCKNDTETKKSIPIIENMCRFVKEFHHLPATLRVGRRSDKNQKKEQVSINCEPPFEPYWIYKMLNGIRSDSFIIEGVQEDAEEFLGCVLNGLNDEMSELLKLAGSDVLSNLQRKEQDDEKEWQVMGPKNKGCVTRKTESMKTSIVDIFGGKLRSRVYRSGDQSTDNIQPFFTLQLNIENVNSVYEALEILVSKNQLEGVTSSKTNEEVEAWQQVMLEELPIVLILHLKCFNFKKDGCTKIIKPIEFPVDLKIDSKLLSSKKNYTAKEKQYKLFAVVCHDGKEITKGHYITDAYHVGYASWLRYDDASVKTVLEENMLKPQGSRVPYLLFYRRSDSVRSK